MTISLKIVIKEDREIEESSQSAAKGVRRHGVDPNRSRNEEVMLSLSSPPSALSLSSRSNSAATSAPSDRSPGHHTWGRSPDRSQMNHDTTANNPRPSAAAAVAGVGRKKAMEADGATRTSSRSISSVSQPNQSSEVSGARQNFKRRPPRDRSSSDHLGGSAEFSAEI
ncbi:zinc ion-binding protein, partial [Prunus dulcis]